MYMLKHDIHVFKGGRGRGGVRGGGFLGVVTQYPLIYLTESIAAFIDSFVLSAIFRRTKILLNFAL